MPADVLDEFIAWIGRLDDMDEEQRRRESEEWGQRFPALHVWQGGEWREVYDLTQEGKLEGAERLYKRALKRDPSVKGAWGNLGAMAIWAGDPEAGEKYLRRALEVDPLYPFAVCNLVMLRLNEDKWE